MMGLLTGPTTVGNKGSCTGVIVVVVMCACIAFVPLRLMGVLGPPFPESQPQVNSVVSAQTPNAINMIQVQPGDDLGDMATAAVVNQGNSGSNLNNAEAHYWWVVGDATACDIRNDCNTTPTTNWTWASVAVVLVCGIVIGFMLYLAFRPG